jgi:hypothetical protein
MAIVPTGDGDVDWQPSDRLFYVDIYRSHTDGMAHPEGLRAA